MTLETAIFQSEVCPSYLSASLQATGNVRGCAETPGLPRSWPDVHTWRSEPGFQDLGLAQRSYY